MKYSYGYLKDAVLAKMDLQSSEANDLSLLNKIPFYANEGLVQITYGIKAAHKYCVFNVKSNIQHKIELRKKYNLDKTNFLDDDTIPDSALSPVWLKAREEYNKYSHTDRPCDMPEDFILWNQNKVFYSQFDGSNLHEVAGSNYTTYGDDQIIFYTPGVYRVPYDAYWCHFTPTMPDDTEIEMPQDIMECLPAYIASQLFKIDDEQKASILRNEWEIAISRIDDNTAQSNAHIRNGRDW